MFIGVPAAREAHCNKVKRETQNWQLEPFLPTLMGSKNENENCKRILHDGTNGNSDITTTITWCDYLKAVDTLYPGHLLVPHVCSASLDFVSHVLHTAWL